MKPSSPYFASGAARFSAAGVPFSATATFAAPAARFSSLMSGLLALAAAALLLASLLVMARMLAPAPVRAASAALCAKAEMIAAEVRTLGQRARAGFAQRKGATPWRRAPLPGAAGGWLRTAESALASAELSPAQSSVSVTFVSSRQLPAAREPSRMAAASTPARMLQAARLRAKIQPVFYAKNALGKKPEGAGKPAGERLASTGERIASAGRRLEPTERQPEPVGERLQPPGDAASRQPAGSAFTGYLIAATPAGVSMLAPSARPPHGGGAAAGGSVPVAFVSRKTLARTVPTAPPPLLAWQGGKAPNEAGLIVDFPVASAHAEPPGAALSEATPHAPYFFPEITAMDARLGARPAMPLRGLISPAALEEAAPAVSPTAIPGETPAASPLAASREPAETVPGTNAASAPHKASHLAANRMETPSGTPKSAPTGSTKRLNILELSWIALPPF